MGAVESEALARRLADTLGTELELPPAVSCPYPDWRELSRWVAAVAQARNASVIAVSGSQGSGKTTLSEVLARTLAQSGRAPLHCSLDDFYLPAAERRRLAQAVHPLLATRGVPGTHDWAWLEKVLQTLSAGAAEVTHPVFDKGLDDRAGTRTVSADTLVLEGWCLGVTAQPAAALDAPCNALELEEDADGIWRRYVNAQLRAHYEPLWDYVDLWVHLRVPGFEQVVAWRTQQEQQLPAARRMRDADIRRFIQHYERLTRWLWAQPAKGPGLVVQIDPAHRVAQVTFSAASAIPV